MKKTSPEITVLRPPMFVKINAKTIRTKEIRSVEKVGNFYFVQLYPQPDGENKYRLPNDEGERLEGTLLLSAGLLFVSGGTK